MQELKELQRQGMSIQAISKLTGWDRKTIRKYMQAAGVVPAREQERAASNSLASDSIAPKNAPKDGAGLHCVVA